MSGKLRKILLTSLLSAAPLYGQVWTITTVPANLSAPDPNSVELGMKFTSSVDGNVSGVRFYKGPGNTGAHIGNLWNSAGVNLATGAFANETDSGWQTLTFTSPVSISANTQYIVSYHAPVGHYSYDYSFFSKPLTVGPLMATGSAYRYGTGGLPASASTTNYWVDVLFNSGAHPQTFSAFNFSGHLRYCAICGGTDDSTTGLNILTGTKLQLYQGTNPIALLTADQNGDVAAPTGIPVDVSQGVFVFNLVALAPNGTNLCTGPQVQATYPQPPNNCMQIAIDPSVLGSWALNPTSGIPMWTSSFTTIGLILRLDAATTLPRGSQIWSAP